MFHFEDKLQNFKKIIQSRKFDKEWAKVLAKDLVWLTCLAILISIFTYSCITLFNYYQGGQYNNAFYNSILGSFFGASFPVIFLIAQNYITRIYKKWKLHQNALVSLEKILNDFINQLDINIYSIEDFKSVHNKGGVWYGNFRNLVLSEEIIERLQNLDLINKLFVYYEDVSRVNNDIATVKEMIAIFRNGLIDEKINKETYNLNISNIIGNVDLVSSFIHDLQNQTTNILATIRILLRYDSRVIMKVVEDLFKIPATIISENEISQEKQTLESEIRQTREDSIKRIDNILNYKG